MSSKGVQWDPTSGEHAVPVNLSAPAAGDIRRELNVAPTAEAAPAVILPGRG
jgi:hypothetical protein